MDELHPISDPEPRARIDPRQTEKDFNCVYGLKNAGPLFSDERLCLARHLTKIESRPIAGKTWSICFILTSRETRTMRCVNALENLKEIALTLRVPEIVYPRDL